MQAEMKLEDVPDDVDIRWRPCDWFFPLGLREERYFNGEAPMTGALNDDGRIQLSNVS